MTPLAQMVLDLADSLVFERHDDLESSTPVTVRALDLALPMETRLADRDVFRASLPRDRLHTGFERPLGRIRLSFRREAP